MSDSFTRTYLAGDFVMSAGSVLFRREADTGRLQMCLLYQPDRQEWLLPKGRKDRGESIEAAAVRETYEETGYPCELVPLRMTTRATIPGGVHDNNMNVSGGCLEPIAVMLQDRGVKGAKVVWWYVSRIKDGATKVEGTQMATENFESYLLYAEEAIPRLSLAGHRDIARQALQLVMGTEEVLQKRII